MSARMGSASWRPRDVLRNGMAGRAGSRVRQGIPSPSSARTGAAARAAQSAPDGRPDGAPAVVRVGAFELREGALEDGTPVLVATHRPSGQETIIARGAAPAKEGG